MNGHPQRKSPRVPWIAYAVVIVVFAAVVFGPHIKGVLFGGSDTRSTETGALLQSRDLRFEGLAEDISIYDASTNELIFLIEDGDAEGFLRGLVRALAHERKVNGGEAEAPYRLEIFSNGRLTLVDSVTDKVMILNAFGNPGVNAFTRFFKPQQQPQSQQQPQQQPQPQQSAPGEAPR